MRCGLRAGRREAAADHGARIVQGKARLQIGGGAGRGEGQRTGNMRVMSVTREVSQPEMSALKLRRPSRLKSSLMSVTPETSQHSMAPYFAVVEAAFEEYSSTAFVREAFHVKVWPVQAGGDGDGDGERAGGLGDGGLGEGGGGEGLNGGGKGLGGGGEGDGGERMRSMRCSETPRISSSVRPRGHTTTSAIAKFDFSWL